MLRCLAARALLLASVVVLPLAIPRLRAQVPDEKTRSFEVASIKPNVSGSIVVNQHIENGRYTGTNLSLMDLIVVTHATPRSRIVGAANWVSTDRFDITAKAQGLAPSEQVVAMLRALLTERFKLAVRTDTRDGGVYDLVVARSDGRLGPLLKRSTANCMPIDGSPPPSGQPVAARCPGGNYPGRIKATAITMTTLTGILSPWLDQREARDRTGLSGRFDIDVTFTPDRAPRLPPNAPDDLVRAVQAIDPDGPSLFTALQEQLGLKLEATTDKIDVLVIDRAEKPTPD
jgi:uncharacterized protein (TIGR03435 family)